MFLHHGDGFVNVGIGVHPVRLTGSEFAGADFPCILAFSQTLDHDVAVGDEAGELAVVAADGKRTAVHIPHQPGGFLKSLILFDALGIGCHEFTYGTHGSSFIDWGYRRRASRHRRR
ncbi:hypothetical protein D3C72_2175180 [compost metagenome]